MAKTKEGDIKKLAKKLGVTESTIRARRTRGTKLDAPRQIRLTTAQQKKIAGVKGVTHEIAAKFGVSVSTVKRLRRLRAAKQL